MTPSQRMRANRDAIHAYYTSGANQSGLPESEWPIHAHLKAADEHAEDAAQVQALIDHGKCQEANEKSFCLGMMAGGAVALTVLVLTLRLTGVI